MTGSEFVGKMAWEWNCPVAEAKRRLDTLWETIEKEAKASPIVIRGFGKWLYKTRAARQGINPKTGEKVSIPAKTKLVFQSTAKTGQEE